MQGSPSRVSRTGTLLAAAATLACLLPFAGRAFHVDDPLNLWVAQQIHEDPLRFFDLRVNWSGTELPFAMESKNPPLVSYYTAAAAALLGWGERALHLAFLLPALGVVLATGGLARRLGGDPLLASLACLATPVFLVSATTLMSDVPMLALFCLALLSWMRGIEEERRGWLLAGGILAGLCALTKYFGLALLPLLVAWTLARQRRLGPWALWLLVPVAMVTAYETWTAEVYGSGLIAHAAGFSLWTRPGDLGGLERLAIALVFAGGAFAPLLFFAPLALSRRRLGAGAALAAVLLAAWLALVGARGDANLVAHAALFAAAGAALWLWIVPDRSQLDAGALLLGLWALGTLAFAAWVNYTTNGRSLLPMAPALAIALARAARVRDLGALARYGPLAPALALSLAVAWGDAAQADAPRRAAERFDARVDAAGQRWLDGHWGFQLYLERRGWRALDARRSVLRPGDWLARPLGWKDPLRIPEAASHRVLLVEIPVAAITTMALDTAAGFYAIQWGPLPWRWRPGHREAFELRRLGETVLFERDAEALARRGDALREADRWLDARRAAPPPSACAGLADRLPEALARCAWCAAVAECRECLAAELGLLGASRECIAAWTAEP